MKSIVIKIVLLSLWWQSCTKDRLIDTEDREIRIVAAVTATKAPINSTFTTNFPIGLYARGNAWLAGTGANWINNDAATVLGVAGHAVTFSSGPYYYPSNGSTLNFYAFAPRATETTAATAGGSPKVTHTINGQQDVMWATSTGYKIGSAAAVNPVLNFQHKLTQLQFTFKSGTAFPASGYSVVSLLVKAQPTTVVMTVDTGTCTFSGSADMQALSSTDQTAGIAIVTAGTNANSPVMTAAASGTSAYLLDIVVNTGTGSDITYTNVPLNITTLAGSAHMINLTFNFTAVSVSATIANWTVVSGGGIVIQI